MKNNNFVETLRTAGLRATAGRAAILAALANAKPLSVEKIAQKVKGKIDAANVYRSLEQFLKTGIVRRVDVGHQHMHYELALAVPHHHHYVCETCGARSSPCV